MELVAADIGGTHARFALATIAVDGAVALDECFKVATSAFPGPIEAWKAFADHVGRPLPRAAAIAAAGPVRDDAIVLTNNRWTITATELRRFAGLDRVTLVNDFGAVAHAVARAQPEQLTPICGPDRPLPDTGTITVIGPGTGLGVAYVHRRPGGYRVQATEGGHTGFAPQDDIDVRILAELRTRHPRVVTEHVVAGPGLAAIYTALGGHALASDRAIWSAGVKGGDAVASAAVTRFCASLGAAAGDYALAQGASGVVLAGSIACRLRERLPVSDFAKRFTAKPRYEAMMADIPVKLLSDPHPGLTGAVAAFAKQYGAAS